MKVNNLVFKNSEISSTSLGGQMCLHAPHLKFWYDLLELYLVIDLNIL